MNKRSTSREFIESIARGLDIICAFRPGEVSVPLAVLAERTDLARPTAHRILQTLIELGYAQRVDNGFSLRPKVVELGMAFIDSVGFWAAGKPHMKALAGQLHESTSIVTLDRSDIVYVARVAVAKIIGLSVNIGTRFPAVLTSSGKVLLASLNRDQLSAALDIPSTSAISIVNVPDKQQLLDELSIINEQGWAIADQELAPGIRSVAVPLHDSVGRVIAAINVSAHASETTLEKQRSEHLPALLEAASKIEQELHYLNRRPSSTVEV